MFFNEFHLKSNIQYLVYYFSAVASQRKHKNHEKSYDMYVLVTLKFRKSTYTQNALYLNTTQK